MCGRWHDLIVVHVSPSNRKPQQLSTESYLGLKAASATELPLPLCCQHVCFPIQVPLMPSRCAVTCETDSSRAVAQKPPLGATRFYVARTAHIQNFGFLKTEVCVVFRALLCKGEDPCCVIWPNFGCYCIWCNYHFLWSLYHQNSRHQGGFSVYVSQSSIGRIVRRSFRHPSCLEDHVSPLLKVFGFELKQVSLLEYCFGLFVVRDFEPASRVCRI